MSSRWDIIGNLELWDQHRRVIQEELNPYRPAVVVGKCGLWVSEDSIFR